MKYNYIYYNIKTAVVWRRVGIYSRIAGKTTCVVTTEDRDKYTHHYNIYYNNNGAVAATSLCIILYRFYHRRVSCKPDSEKPYTSDSFVVLQKRT